MHPRIGLYYPYVNPPANWLKLAALYWPKMARWYFGEEDDSELNDEVTQTLIDELDFVVTLSPSPVLPDVEARLRAALDEFGTGLKQRYRSHGYDPPIGWGDNNPEAVDWWNIGPQENEDDWPFVDELFEHGLLVLDDVDNVLMHSRFGWVYYSMIAEEIARTNKLMPITDQGKPHIGIEGWTNERLGSYLLDEAKPLYNPISGIESTLGFLAIRLVIPSDLEAVPASKIVKVRKRYGTEFDRFTDLVAQASSELSEELSGISDARIAKAYMAQEVSRRFENPLADLRKAMRGVGIDTTVGITTTKFELPAAAVAAVGGWAAGQPIVGAAGAALGLMALKRQSNMKKREHLDGSPVSYLLLAERKLGTRGLLKRILKG